jgi:hypothetical protein
VQKKEIDRSVIERTKGDRAHSCVKPTLAAVLFWKFLILGFWLILVAQGFNLTHFRVSRILLDSINRLVNIEKEDTLFLEKNLLLSWKRFSGFILFLYFIL